MSNFVKRLIVYGARHLPSLRVLDGNNPLLINGNPGILYKFGEKNKNLIFYVIQQESKGRGLCSLLSSVLQHIKIALDHGFIPVIDMLNFRTEYHFEGSNYNLWDELFKPISPYSLTEVYESNNVIFSTNYFPINAKFDVFDLIDFQFIYSNFFIINKEFKNEIDLKIIEMGVDLKNCIGVHARGREQRIARGHRFPPSIKQIISNIDFALDKANYDKIFLVTEDINIFRTLLKKYGSKIVYLDVPREAYNIYMCGDEYRPNHKLRLAKEVFMETLALSRCKSFIGSVSNVSNFACFLNNKHYYYRNIITNPKNTELPIVCYLMWYFRSRIPLSLGGFPEF